MLLRPFLTPRSALSFFTVVPVLIVAACNDTDPLPVFFDLSYQVGCVRPECLGVFHEPERVVMALDGERDGEDTFENTCTAQNVDGAKVVSLRSSKNNTQSFSINGALVGVPGNVGASCLVTIVEGANRYQGKCSAMPPTPQVPCQLTEFGKSSNGLLEGKLYCDNIPVATSPSTTRDIAKAGTFGNCRVNGQAAPQSQCPAEFLIDPCNGL